MITPRQAKDAINEEDKALIAKLEAQIDKALAKYWDTPIEVCPDGNFGNASRRVIAKIVEMYSPHWHVRVKNCPVENYGGSVDVLVFSEKSDD